ncbi:MAG: PUA domain-containing protein, partial [Thermoplasmata archaeon]
HPIDEVWREFPPIVLKESAASAVAHGAGLASGGILALPKPFSRDARVALVNRAGELIATGVARHDSAEMGGVAHGWVVEDTRVFVDADRFPALWQRAKGAKGFPPAADTAR